MENKSYITTKVLKTQINDGKTVFDELSSKIINSAIRVHKKLGPGFMESIYENALCIDLLKENINFEQQKGIKIYYEGEEIGIHRIDLAIENKIIVELNSERVRRHPLRPGNILFESHRLENWSSLEFCQIHFEN